jgi:hypothetical protein
MIPNITNATRRGRAEKTLRFYVETRGEAFEGSSSEAADLIADLLHWVQALDEPLPIGQESHAAGTLFLAQLHFDADYGNPEEEG